MLFQFTSLVFILPLFIRHINDARLIIYSFTPMTYYEKARYYDYVGRRYSWKAAYEIPTKNWDLFLLGVFRILD